MGLTGALVTEIEPSARAVEEACSGVGLRLASISVFCVSVSVASGTIISFLAWLFWLFGVIKSVSPKNASAPNTKHPSNKSSIFDNSQSAKSGFIYSSIYHKKATTRRKTSRVCITLLTALHAAQGYLLLYKRFTYP